ncbi:MAG: hypothetical protein D3908_14140 [Candidatus Electrothrix sp. AUS4]|nr:hypothetical protein [Candidatus Electrothrix sp. AUS4]
MSNSGQSGKLAVFYERAKRIVTNTTFQWFIGLLVAIAGVIITLLSYMQDGEPVKKDEGPEEPPYRDEYTIPRQYTVAERQPLFIRDASTNLSIRFQNIEGEEFVSLNISPTGKKLSVRPVLRGYTEAFTSSEGVFNIQILDIDYTNRKVAVQVSRKI